MSDAEQPRFCTSCGKTAAGKFCAFCGTPVAGAAGVMPNPTVEGWTAVAHELVAPPAQPYGVIPVLRRLIVRPIGTMLDLAADPAFTGQWKLLLTALGLFFTVLDVFLPRLFIRFMSLKLQVGTRWQGIVFEIETILAILILAPAMYYLCRALSGQRRSPRAYLKLAVLGFSYWYLLFLALILAIIGLLLLVAWPARALGMPLPQTAAQVTVGSLILAADTISAGWLTAAINKQFWPLPWKTAIAISVGYVLVSQGILFPLLDNIAYRLDLQGWLTQMFG